uniref:Signal peptide peptidase n=1 Tax=Meloidogyne javanica TaxID=6303 RepID=A0A915M5I6_MELJA
MPETKVSEPSASSTPDGAAANNATVVYTFEEQVMAYSSLYAMAIICIIWGTIRSLAFVKNLIEKKELIETSITTREAKRFPLTASAVLFTLYLIFKTNDGGIGFLLDKVRPYVSLAVYERLEWAQNFVHSKLSLLTATNSTLTGTAASATNSTVNGTIFGGILQKVASIHPVAGTLVDKLPEMNKQNLIYFLLLLLCWEGCIALATILKPFFSAFLSRLPIGDRWPRRNVPWVLVLKRGKQPMKEGKVEMAGKKEVDYFLFSEWDTHLSIAVLCCSAVGISHLYRRHWITNNLLGVAFSIFGIENLHLASFKAGTILLAGLFIYDVFWVFATDVMTTVAKGIDAPILLMFPQDLLRNGWLNASKHGMLGLGDIVIPGIFVALLYRFDHHIGSKQKGGGQKKRYYCWVTIFAYAFGLFVTMGVMHYFKAAQPALLYLVPSCLLLPLGFAALRGEFSDLWNYSEEHLVEKDESDKSSKDEGSDKKKKKAANETANATSAPVGGGKAQKQENKKSK